MLIILIYSPFPSVDTAKDVAKSLLESKLAACANIIKNLQSLYMWEGELQITGEVLLLIKTCPEQELQVLKKIEQMHPYQVPCVLSFSSQANESFFEWVKNQTASTDSISGI